MRRGNNSIHDAEEKKPGKIGVIIRISSKRRKKFGAGGRHVLPSLEQKLQ